MPVLGCWLMIFRLITGVFFVVIFLFVYALVCSGVVVYARGLDFGYVEAILVKALVWGGLQTIWWFGSVTHRSSMLPDSQRFSEGSPLLSRVASGAGYRRLSTNMGHLAQTDVLACVRLDGGCFVGVHFFLIVMN